MSENLAPHSQLLLPKCWKYPSCTMGAKLDWLSKKGLNGRSIRHPRSNHVPVVKDVRDALVVDRLSAEAGERVTRTCSNKKSELRHSSSCPSVLPGCDGPARRPLWPDRPPQWHLARSLQEEISSWSPHPPQPLTLCLVRQSQAGRCPRLHISQPSTLVGGAELVGPAKPARPWNYPETANCLSWRPTKVISLRRTISADLRHWRSAAQRSETRFKRKSEPCRADRNRRGAQFGVDLDLQIFKSLETKECNLSWRSLGKRQKP